MKNQLQCFQGPVVQTLSDKQYEWRSVMQDNPEPISESVIQFSDLHTPSVRCSQLGFHYRVYSFPVGLWKEYLHCVKYLMISKKEQMGGRIVSFLTVQNGHH